jgi:hypothetical protein
MAKEQTNKEKEEKQSEAPEEETVVVSKKQLTDILNKLERLEFATDKGRLEHYDNAQKPKELTRVRLNVYEDSVSGSPKVVMAWKMIINESGYDTVRGYYERQIIQLTFDDGNTVEIPYTDFTLGKRRKQQQAEILSRSKDENTGFEIFKVRRVDDGKEFEVDSRFIN